jgi:uncharacterized repeat protein (TIGR03806 family)
MKLALASAVAALVVLSACGGGSSSSNDNSGGGGTSEGPFGLDARVAPSTLQIPVDGASSGAVTLVNAFPNLSFNGPLVLIHPGDNTNRLFVAERGGIVKVFENDPATTQATTVLDLESRVDSAGGEAGFLGLAFDPNFSSNRYFYVSYATQDTVPRKVRLARYRISNSNPSAVEANSERVLLEIDHVNGYHFGGWIGFGPDGLLYMTHGDAGNLDQVQDTALLYGKVLRMRINSDATAYSVPPDNPYGNLVWARGLRNPWRCSFDRVGNGDLWCGDVGNSEREEVNLIRRGANYGWPIYEGSRPFENPTNRPYSDFDPPVYEYDHATGAAVIGGYVYRGSAHPALVGRYLYGDYAAQTLWSLQFDGNGNVSENSTLSSSGPTFMIGMGEDRSGELYVLSGHGQILGLQAAAGGGSAPQMPATLSATGLFTDLAQLTPAPGMIDYEPNAPFWSDGATKRRWVIVPDGQTIGFSADDPWSFPVGTITVKHFELPLAAGGTTRLETRVMVHRSSGWAGYTYRWRGDQREADLVAAGGASATYQTLNPATNTPTSLTWNFPSRTQCMNCHTAASGRVLGLNTRQFNGNHTYAATGRSDNQLRTLNHIGLFSSDIGAASQYTAMPDPSDTSAALGLRARAYLDTNCAICHQPGGPTPVNMDLRFTTDLSNMNIVGVASGTAGLQRVAPGNHAGSDLWRRASSADSAVRMPPLGVQMVDAQAVQMLATWIDGLPP